MAADRLPAPPGREPDLDDDFAGGIDPHRWVPHYLPHWTTPDRSLARTAIVPDGVQLRIEEVQPDWRPEDAPLRVSNLQTGVFSGPVGSARGTHRYRLGLAVRTETPERLLWSPSGGRLDITVSATADPGCMLAAWLVGTEHRHPAESAEICLFEIDGAAVGERTIARTGIKAHHDERVLTDMAEVELPFDARRPHTWTVIWGAGRLMLGCEGVVLRHLAQSTNYPMLLMLDLFEVAAPAGDYPKAATVHRVRGWSDQAAGAPSGAGRAASTAEITR